MTEEQKKTLIEDILDEQYDDITSDLEKTSYKYGWNNGLKRATIRIEAFKEERPHGRWIDTGEAIGDDVEAKCSICGEELFWYANYCPNCGSRMEE